MDAKASEASPSILIEQPLSLITPLQQSLQRCQRCQRHCFGNDQPGEFPLATNPTIVLHVLTSCDSDPEDLARLEATCKFFRQPANYLPDNTPGYKKSQYYYYYYNLEYLHDYREKQTEGRRQGSSSYSLLI